MLLAEESLSPERFLGLYTDESFDVIWVTAHGLFDPREPHQSLIELSEDKSAAIRLTDLLRHPVRGPGRRLLFLNICLGGTVFITEAPAKLGLGALLASAHQAVIGHLWEVGSFVAPRFGLLTAVGLERGTGFFPAFSFAADRIRGDREALVALLRGEAHECTELLERV